MNKKVVNHPNLVMCRLHRILWMRNIYSNIISVRDDSVQSSAHLYGLRTLHNKITLIHINYFFISHFYVPSVNIY